MYLVDSYVSPFQNYSFPYKKKRYAKALQKLKKMKPYDDITKFRNKYITGMVISALWLAMLV